MRIKIHQIRLLSFKALKVQKSVFVVFLSLTTLKINRELRSLREKYNRLKIYLTCTGTDHVHKKYR